MFDEPVQPARRPHSLKLAIDVHVAWLQYRSVVERKELELKATLQHSIPHISSSMCGAVVHKQALLFHSLTSTLHSRYKDISYPPLHQFTVQPSRHWLSVS